MKQYRKKPVVIEAVQIDGTEQNAAEIIRWVNSNTPGFKADDSSTLVIALESTAQGRRNWLLRRDGNPHT